MGGESSYFGFGNRTHRYVAGGEEAASPNVKLMRSVSLKICLNAVTSQWTPPSHHSANTLGYSLCAGPALDAGESAVNNRETSLVLKQLTV